MLEMRSHHRALARDLIDLEKRIAMEARQTEATMATRNALLGAQGATVETQKVELSITKVALLCIHTHMLIHIRWFMNTCTT